LLLMPLLLPHAAASYADYHADYLIFIMRQVTPTPLARHDAAHAFALD